MEEVKKISQLPDFKGMIYDLSGPTANMYGFECPVKLRQGACQDRRCIYPEICPILPINHKRQIDLLKKIRQLKGVKKVFVGSGLRYDLLMSDGDFGGAYLHNLVQHHWSA